MKMYKKPAIKTSEVGLVQMIAESINGDIQGTNSIAPETEEIHGSVKEHTAVDAAAPAYDPTRW
ncbi:MAG: hypothetical protein MJZ20_12875 [Bacteroidaceae bacterium]|nr:hypothetical protein [Bacteroidaceae bacterium]